jgi:hypothetical protein
MGKESPRAGARAVFSPRNAGAGSRGSRGTLLDAQMKSPARSLKLPAGLDGPTRCRCRLGSQRGLGDRITPEAKIASKRGRGYHRCGPTGWVPDHSGPCKVGEDRTDYQCSIPMGVGHSIAACVEPWDEPDGWRHRTEWDDERLQSIPQSLDAITFIAVSPLSGVADNSQRARLTQLFYDSAVN